MQDNVSQKVKRCPYQETEWNYNLKLQLPVQASGIKRKLSSIYFNGIQASFKTEQFQDCPLTGIYNTVD